MVDTTTMALNMSIQEVLEQAIEQQQTSGRIWLYSNYHCNLACKYCLTSSNPRSPQRSLRPEQMIEAASQAQQLGFRTIGVTGGEPFLQPNMPKTLNRLAELLPTIVLTNGTLFIKQQIKAQLDWLSHPNLQVQLSIDDSTEELHDRYRGQGTFKRAMHSIPLLLEHGVQVRISSTRVFDTPEDAIRETNMLKNWVSSIGLKPEDIVVRTMVRRGQAEEYTLGINAESKEFPADLTLTRMGAYLSPFGPTVQNGRVQTDLLLTRTVLPLNIPVQNFLQVLGNHNHSASQSSGFV